MRGKRQEEMFECPLKKVDGNSGRRQRNFPLGEPLSGQARANTLVRLISPLRDLNEQVHPTEYTLHSGNGGTLIGAVLNTKSLTIAGFVFGIPARSKFDIRLSLSIHSTFIAEVQNIKCNVL